MLKLILLITLIALTFSAQVPPCDRPGFDLCLVKTKQFSDSTCLPLSTTNQSNYNACLCYQSVHLGYCYGLCQDNSTLVDEYQNVVTPETEKACKVAKLDPNALPATPVWQNSELTPTDSSISSAATATESSTTGSKGQTSGATGVSVGWLFVAGLTSLLF